MLAPLVLIASLLAAQGQAAPATPADDLPKVAHQAELDGESKVGEKYSKEVEKEYKISKDTAGQARIEHIGQTLAKIANHNIVQVSWGDRKLNPFHYKFTLIEGSDVNAFSLPGGYIYVFEGLLKFAQSDDELAGVLAHEISHASFRHVHTMEREMSKQQLLTLPLILISIFGGGGNGVTAGAGPLGQLLGMAQSSGWSVKAEQAADYGGLQYMVKSPYNPVGMLTFMERLAKNQRHYENMMNYTIFQTHPPSRERAESLMTNLEKYKIPVRRSLVSPSYSVQEKAVAKGVELIFDGRTILTVGGSEAKDRARDIAVRMNEFYDAVPDLFEVSAQADGAVIGQGRTLFTVTEDDAKVEGKSVKDAAKDSVDAIKRSLYLLAYRVWDTR